MPHNEINFEGKTVVELYEDIVKQNIVNLSSITLSSFRESLLRDNVDATDSDWSFLKELIPESAAFQGENFPNETAMFQSTLAHFERHLPFDVLDVNAEWSKFLGTYVYMTKAQAEASGHPELLSYEEVYTAYFGTSVGFKELLQEYYVETLEKTGKGSVEDGFFLPSHSFEGWVLKVQRLSVLAGEGLGLTLQNTSSARVAVIDRILRLLIEMVDVIQRIAASQAERLTFLTSWQRAYTDLLSQIPVFTNANVRDALNQKIEPFQESIRSQRSLVQDDSKAIQSVINQSQDAANQQTNIGTALLQQLSTITAAILK
jgi:hypothetical protein